MSDWQVQATDVKVGDRSRSLGPRATVRTVVSVEHLCNCNAGFSAIDPGTREPLHYLVVRIEAGALVSFVAATNLVWLTDAKADH